MITPFLADARGAMTLLTDVMTVRRCVVWHSCVVWQLQVVWAAHPDDAAALTPLDAVDVKLPSIS